MTITLCGSPVSNYYNKVKLALLEKGVAFEEEKVNIKNRDEALLGCSPLGKIPFLRTPQGALCESQAIMEYIESAWPVPPLLPRDPYAAAKVRELTTFIDWHMEMAVRPLYGPAFSGMTMPSQDELDSIRGRINAAIEGFRRLMKFSPYVAGDEFTQADCAAFASLPLMGMTTRAVYGEDLLLAAGIDYKPWAKLVAERPSAQKMLADRKLASAK